MNKKIKFSLGIITLSGLVAVPTTVILANVKKNKNNNDFSVYFKGKHFSSKMEVLNYINKNNDVISKGDGEKIYSVSIGGDKTKFINYKNAIDFIKNKLIAKEVYIKPNQSLDTLTNEISPDQFIDKANSKRFKVFKKNFKDNKGRFLYTFAPVDDIYALKKARNDAAKSYIQSHTAYFFDDIYFNSLNDVKSYILSRPNSYKYDKNHKNSSYSALDTKNNGLLIFDKGSILVKDPNFRNQIRRLASPYYFPNNQKINPVEINYGESSNVNTLKSIMSEKKLKYIKVNNNGDEITQITDMNRATPNGNIYGNYYFKTGLGMKGVDVVSNWNKANSNDLPKNRKELLDISILKSSINYILKSNGYNSPLDLLFTTLISGDNTTTMADFLRQVDTKVNYLEEAVKLINTLNKGVRYNHLDAIIALHSFLINKMIKNNVDSQKIITLSKYFNSMAILLDSFIGTIIAPFLVNSNDGKEASANTYSINYFRSAFNFYNPEQLGLGISFQNNPFSYYRKLTGYNNGSSNQSMINRKVIFNLIKSVMGMQSIAMSALRHNQLLFAKLENEFIDNMKNNFWNINTSIFKNPGFSTTNKKDEFWDFSFLGSDSNSESNEYRGIWKNINDINNTLKINNLKYNKVKIKKNLNKYLLNFQNSLIKSYKEKINKKINFFNLKYVIGRSKDGKQPKKTDKLTKKDIKEYFNTNTIDFIDIDTTLILDKIPNSKYAIKHLNDMVKNAVMPIRERVKDVITSVGTFAAKAAIAVATSGAAAEATIIEEEVASSIVKSSNSIKVIRTPKYTMNYRRSSSYRASQVIKRKKIHYKKGNNKKISDQLKELAKIDTSNSGETNSGALENKISAFYGELYGSVFGKEIGALVGDVFDVGIRIIKNVIPGVSTLFQVVDSFSKTDIQIYKYSQGEDGSDLYWDGGKVDYSWWGLKSDQVFSIKDLKMVLSPEIIGGYNSANSGFYYGNKFHDTLDELKQVEAQTLIKKINNEYRWSDFKQKNIRWTLKLKGLDNKYFCTIADLIKGMAKIASNSNISKEIYITSSGLLTPDKGKVFEDSIKSTLNALKPVLIIKMPKINKFGLPETEGDFALPYPRWSNGRVVEKNKAQTNLIIFNPNVNIPNDKSIQNELVNTEQNELIDIKQLIKTLTSLSNQENSADYQKFENFISNFAKNILVSNKEVIYEEINDPSKSYYDSLDGEWTKKTKVIYYFNDALGKTEYFINKKTAIKKMFSKNNYSLKTIVMGKITKIYKFDNKIFASINEIYNYILKQGGKNV